MLIIFGTAVGLLLSSVQSQMVLGSPQGGAPGSDASSSNQGEAEESPNPCVTDPNKCKQPDNSEQSQGSSQGTVPNSGSRPTSNPNQEAIDHINQAQSALQNGDTVGAQRHMDLAKQALICNPGDPAHC